MAFRFKTLREISSHPLTRQDPRAALRRYAAFHLSQRLLPHPLLYPWIGPLQLIARRGWAGVVGNLYTGLYDFEEMGFLLHCLRQDEYFVDAGANAGVYSLLAAGICQARVLALEPVPEAFALLEAQIRVNQLSGRVDARQLGVGAEPGRLSFTLSQGTMNHVVLRPEPGEAVLEVPVCSLDQLTDGPVHLLKIDTEGFELPVLQGAAACLARPELQAVIIELNGSGARYGYADLDADALLRQAGFAPCRYDPRARSYSPLPSWRQDQHNTLYLRDSESLRTRLRQAPLQECLGQRF